MIKFLKYCYEVFIGSWWMSAPPGSWCCRRHQEMFLHDFISIGAGVVFCAGTGDVHYVDPLDFYKGGSRDLQMVKGG